MRLSRRAVVAGLAAAPVAAQGMTIAEESIWLGEAAAAMGGFAALRAAPVLRWTGEGTVFAGERTIRIGTQTVVEPFGYARSRTWLIDRPKEVRELLIDGDEGLVIINSVANPMKPAMRLHERDQYSLYGLMRLAPLEEWPKDVLWTQGKDGATAEVRHAGLPDTTFTFDHAWRLTQARNRVRGEAGGAPVEQDIRFEGEIEGGGIRWPRRIAIRRGGLPYFQLDLTTFQPGRTRELPVSRPA